MIQLMEIRPQNSLSSAMQTAKAPCPGDLVSVKAPDLQMSPGIPGIISNRNCWLFEMCLLKRLESVQ